jgi:hypothetical protein
MAKARKKTAVTSALSNQAMTLHLNALPFPEILT